VNPLWAPALLVALAVSSIDSALPVLLAAPLEAHGVREPVVVDNVRQQGGGATATWHAGPNARGVATLQFRSDVWWLVDGGTAKAVWPSPQSGAIADDGGSFHTVLSSTGTALPASLIVRGRAPTPGEMQPTPGEDAIFFFSADAAGAAPVTVPAGTTLDVWCPFALDTGKHYALWLSFVHPDIAGDVATLQRNTLHFTLPAFTVSPGKTALGEVDGDPVEVR
jgi:hypothetical protein